MKISDLRIGNKVFIVTKPDSEGMALGEIVGLTPTKIGGCVAGVRIEGGVVIANMDVIQGIPLIAELLTTHNFKRGDNVRNNDSFYVLEIGKLTFAINPDNGVCFVEMSNKINDSIKLPTPKLFFHELQNVVFSLTGEELSAKN